MPECLQLRHDGPVARVTLNRPQVRNAFDAELIGELDSTFRDLHENAAVRAIVLDGAGKTFSGGADITWMRASLELSDDENVADATRMSAMFRAIDRCAKPVIAKIHGAALGGGCGLAAVADIAVAENDTIFGFTETKLGIIPAVISPFVIAKIGVSAARALFLTGERFSAAHARDIGLIHHVAPADALDVRVDQIVSELLSAAPSAIAAAKQLIVDVAAADYDATQSLTARAIARQRTSIEGQEGLRAFLDRREPSWKR